jgi:D-alanyl-D-alanine carboxypeptidase
MISNKIHKLFIKTPYGVSISSIINGTNHSYSYGKRNGTDNVDNSTLFNIGSISKSIIAILFFKLFESKIISLDSDARKYFSNLDSPLPICRLLNHTSGIVEIERENDVIQNIQNNKSPDLSKVFKVGSSEEFHYCNFNYYILTNIIESIYNSTLNLILDKTFKELSLISPQILNNDIGNIALPFTHSSREFLKMCPSSISQVGGGAGGLYSNSFYLNQFLYQFFKCNDNRKNPLFSRMTTFENDIYGLGLMKFKINGAELWGHSGNNFGYNSKFLINPKTLNSCVFFINSDDKNLYYDVTDLILKELL